MKKSVFDPSIAGEETKVLRWKVFYFLPIKEARPHLRISFWLTLQNFIQQCGSYPEKKIITMLVFSF